MDTKVNYAMIGAFVIVLLAFISVSIIWLSSGISLTGYSTYQVFMQEAVSGLSIDAAVEYNGVNVGNVKSISISKQNPHLVELLLSIQKGTPITENTQATLNARGLTGLTYIALKDPGTNLTPIHKLPDEPYPIIKTGPSLFLQLDTALGKLNENVSHVSDALKILLDQENLASFKQILLNTRQITATLARNKQKLAMLLNNTAEATQILTAQTLPATNRVLFNLDVATTHLSSLVLELQANPALLIRGKSQPPLGPGES